MRARFLRDQAQDACKAVLVEHRCDGDAQHFDALAAEPGVAACVTGGIVAAIVRKAVNLDREARRRQVEVEHASAQWVLLAEAQAVERLAPQSPPEDDLR